MNPLKVEDGTDNHAHVPSNSSEPKIWIPQARSIIGLLLLLATLDMGTLQAAWNDVHRETEEGASKVQVKDASVLEVLLSTIKGYEKEELKALDEDERRTLIDFSTFLSLVNGDEASKAEQFTIFRENMEKDRDTRTECSGCGKIFAEEKDLQACSKCRIVLYCSAECQTTDWKRYHKETCCYPLS